MKFFKSAIFCVVLMLLSISTNSSKLLLNKANKESSKVENHGKNLKTVSNKVKATVHIHSNTSTKKKSNSDSEDCGCNSD